LFVMRFRNVDDGRFMKRYNTLYSVFLEFCGFIGCSNENQERSEMRPRSGRAVNLKEGAMT